MEVLQKFLASNVNGDLLAWPHQLEMMELFNLTCAETEDAILSSGFLPGRYQRNRWMLTTQQQLELFRCKVAVVGCGGLGGYVLEELARLGVGQIVAIDPDVFEEHNLNRQLLSTLDMLGEPKAQAAERRVKIVNPAVSLSPVQRALSKDNASELLSGVKLVVDAVDSVLVRLELADACCALGLPLVHGAIAGWYGHVATVFPGEDGLRKLYHHWTDKKGIEAKLGNPSFTPAVVASLQVAEACKVLLGHGTPLRNRSLNINLLDMEFTEMPL